MSVIKPFRALRPRQDVAKQVSCVPYDIADAEEVRGFLGDNPHSFLRVTRPEAEFAPDANPSTEDVLTKAKQNLQRLIDEGVLQTESAPCLYIYRLSAGGHSQTGIVACCSLEEYENGTIKKHEKTRPDKVEDRTEHMLALRAQTGLILLAFRGTDTIHDLINHITQTEPIYDFPCVSGVSQTVWRIEKTEPIHEAFLEVPALYIADGHHRMESALHARNRLRGNNPNHAGSEDYNFVMAGIFPAEDLKILAYNRVVKTLNGLSREALFVKIKEAFIVSETDQTLPENHGEICMYSGGKWFMLRFAVQYFREPDPIERLDVTILQQYILAPVLGIDDPRTDERIGFVGGARGTEELVRLVDEGSAEVAFSLYPTTMDDLLAVSDMGEIMPPKSTWFEPKLKDGLLVHLI